MRAQRSIARLAETIKIRDELAERMKLSSAPDGSVAAELVMTRARERIWADLEQRLHEPRSGLIWIGGGAGVGKTHFLNYILALNNRAAPPQAKPARSLTIAVIHTADAPLEREIAEAIGNQLGVERKTQTLWRSSTPADLPRIVFDHARRVGVGEILIAIDFDEGGADEQALRASAEAARAARSPKINVIAAGRATLTIDSAAVWMLPGDRAELLTIAIGRARELPNPPPTRVSEAYDRIVLNGYEPAAIYPFLPMTLDTIYELAEAERPIPSMARLMRAALLVWRKQEESELIGPAAVLRTKAAQEQLTRRLEADGVAAMKLGLLAAQGMRAAEDAQAAADLVNLLIVRRLTHGNEPQALAELATLSNRREFESGRGAGSTLRELLVELAQRSRAVIMFDEATAAARFNPAAADAPEIAAFNQALTPLRQFDASLAQVGESLELGRALEQVRSAMAAALEKAAQVGELMRHAAYQFGVTAPDYHERTVAEFIALAESGPMNLISAARDPERLPQIVKTIRDYQALERLADHLPQLQAMLRFVQGTGFDEGAQNELAPGDALARMVDEWKILKADLQAAVRAPSNGGLPALEAQFNRFKGNYCPRYWSSHAERLPEMELSALLLTDLEQHAAALRRLNRLPALGAPEAEELCSNDADAAMGVRVCDLAGPLADDVPRCPQCHYVLGSRSSREALERRLGQLRRVLERKLAALSENAIALLIEHHDREHRLEGFLRIVQAAQADALIKVLDDKLADYLAALLEENRAELSRQRGAGRLRRLEGRARRS